MIRRISKSNDYRDIIKSCPSGVIDDIYSIRYFISGHPETEVEASFTKKGNLLEVILPTSLLIELGNGVLMRRALYMNSDSDFPDGEYNLEFIDDLNVWLGDEEVDPPFDPGYLTEDDLKTINGDSIVGVGNIDVVNYIPSYYVTESWISSQNFASKTWVENKNYASVVYVQNIISSVESGIVSDLSSYATMSWVSSQSFATEAFVSSAIESAITNGDGDYIWDGLIADVQSQVDALGSAMDEVYSSFATQSWVQSQGYLTASTIPSDIATEAWVLSQNYITVGDLPSGLATQSWVQSQGYLTSVPAGYATMAWVQVNYLSSTSLDGYATEDWVGEQHYATTDDLSVALEDYATKNWVQSQGYLTSVPSGYATESFVTTALSGYATESWVSSQGYLTSVPSGYATESFVTSTLSGYATQSWVSSQGYLSSVPNTYATKSWVSSNFLAESKIWTGTFDQWILLTSAQQALYTIALIIE